MIDNSSIQHPLPGELQQRVENALNQITLAESEFNRLTTLCFAKKSELTSIHTEKNHLESLIQALKIDKQGFEDQVASLNASLNDVSHKVADAHHDLDETKKERDAILAQKETMAMEVRKHQETIMAESTELDKRKKDLTDHEDKHRSRVEKLRKAISE